MTTKNQTPKLAELNKKLDELSKQLAEVRVALQKAGWIQK